MHDIQVNMHDYESKIFNIVHMKSETQSLIHKHLNKTQFAKQKYICDDYNWYILSASYNLLKN